MKRSLLLVFWFPATLLTLVISFSTYANISKTRDLQYLLRAQAKSFAQSSTPFLAYASIPHATQNIKTAIRTGDARPIIIDLYLERYSSPMQGHGEFIIEMAEKYSVDPFLFVAIAQQESNLGKKMPSDDCHNAHGYGIHSRGTLCFESWEVGIETVMKGLSEKFIQKGMVEPEEIMKVYTPHSNGSWERGVNQFIKDLKTGNF